METQREQAQRGRLTGVKATLHQHQLRAKFNVNVQKRVENVLFHVGGWGDIYCKGGRQGETDTTGQRGTREKKNNPAAVTLPSCLSGNSWWSSRSWPSPPRAGTLEGPLMEVSDGLVIYPVQLSLLNIFLPLVSPTRHYRFIISWRSYVGWLRISLKDDSRMQGRWWFKDLYLQLWLYSQEQLFQFFRHRCVSESC